MFGIEAYYLFDGGGVVRSKSNQYPNTSLIQIEGVNTKEEVAWYAGKRMAYIYKAKVKKNGSHYRCIWGKVTRPHGNSGVVRAKFKSNLPPKSMTIRSRVQFFKISALSLVFCVSVVFGNISLRFLPVSFNQAVGATTPFFTAVFAYLMTLKREAWLTYLTLVPVVAGVIIASGGEPSFHLFGFIMCISATAARALKTVLQGILLSSEGEKLNSMNLLLYMAPMAVVFLLPATLIMEENVVGITLTLARDDIKIIWYLLFNSALAYFVNLTNFLVTKHTSALTLQVLGNAKGAVAVVVSILIFRNPVSVTGMLGYTLTVFGVILYSEAKKRSK
ncbi:hypothetical protein Gogos_001993 [Gossypium gossypioides]|uniref:Sugar phosphate transporter domain-containing protein n=1 Tax=Gossypium gossypioides TaxID=34282 RepID=A0A7J9CQV1_GOSGO|nr:hypothetical protein [Gossypium gossypioides]